MAVISKKPMELFADAFAIAGVLMIIIGALTLGMTIVSWISGEVVTLIVALPSITVFVLLIIIGGVFTIVGYYARKLRIPVGK